MALPASGPSPPPAGRLERMQRQQIRLLVHADTAMDDEFPFFRRTAGKGAAVATPLAVGASCIKPYMGVFTKQRIPRGDHLHIAAYPGVVMTRAEYDAMPFLVPTACDTNLSRFMTAAERARWGRDIVVVGLPATPGPNIMSTPGSGRPANAEIVEDIAGTSDVCASQREGGVTKLRVRSDYISFAKIGTAAIPAGSELLVQPYSESFLDDMPHACDECFLLQGPFFACTHAGCDLRFHAACITWIGTGDAVFDAHHPAHIRSLTCRAHTQAEAEAEEEEEDAVSSLLVHAHDRAVELRRTLPRGTCDLGTELWVRISRASWTAAFGVGASVAAVHSRVVQSDTHLSVSLFRIEEKGEGEERPSYFLATFTDAGPRSSRPHPPVTPTNKAAVSTWQWSNQDGSV